MRVSHWEKLAVLFHPLTVTAEVEFVDRDLRLFLRVVVVMPGEEIDPNPETRLGGGERELAERRVEVLFWLLASRHPRDCADCPVHPAEHRCRADEREEQGCTHDDVVFHLLPLSFQVPP